ncbi:ATP-binding protein [Nocardioides piscis]|uniref:histidine kinase n=1 Tax=Nocardioides piscis TaxID=2714938 RepID=A0A6G7YCJ9_9ACTN|nr:sensor histidine kinase [Nocardioides piscis]QIK74634.1 sensor histidine kinase [Nocardioides piscis]
MVRKVSLRTQLLALQLLIVLTTVCLVGVVASLMQAAQIRESYQQQMVGVAQSVATLPSVVDAFSTEDPSATIQPIAELIRQASGVTYVVVTDEEGIRFSHPNPDRIGERVSTDPSVPLSGETYVGTQTGTLGESWRVKLPIKAEDGTVIGTASVGILESELRADLYDNLPWLALWLVGAVLVGTLGAVWVSRLVWRRIYRLEPEEIASLLETREAMLHGIGEGLVAVDDHERIVLVNDQAMRLLDLGPEVVGQRADDVLEPSLLALLGADGESSERMLLAGERILLGHRSDAEVDGRPVGAVLILRDRTELLGTLRELDGARDLTESLRAQAHEFSNRMHVVSGLIEMGRTQEAVDFIARAGQGGSLTDAPVAPGIANPDVVALLLAKTTTSEERGVRLVVDPGSEVGADESTDLVTVLGNLVDNAVDACAPGDTVEVSLRRDDSATVVTVQDDGVGIPEADRDRIFESGWSTKGSSGTRGIGLALVRRVARRRGGDVVVSASAAGGARFDVRLPHRDDLPHSPLEASRPQPRQPTPAGGSG